MAELVTKLDLEIALERLALRVTTRLETMFVVGLAVLVVILRLT
jgi:hypothetical protein